jgi:hypothetical protein
VRLNPRIATRASRGVRLRRGHWSTDGLLICAPMGPQNVADVARSYVGTTNITIVPTATLGGINFTNVGESWSPLPTNDGDVLPTARVTVLVVRQKADTTARDSSLFGHNSVVVTQRCQAHCPYLDGIIYWDFGGTGAGNRISVAWTPTTAEERFAFVAGVNGSAIYLNGLSIASQTSTPLTRTSTATHFMLNAGGSPSGDLQLVSFFAVLDAEWTAGQVAEWTDNPWLMLETPRALWSETVAPPVAIGRVQSGVF